MPLRAVIAVTVLLAASLTGCSGPTEKYCDTLQGDQKSLEKLAASANDPGGDVLTDSVAIFDDLRDRAPDDIADEWDTFDLAWQDLADALKTAGVDPADYRAGKKTAAVTDRQAQAISAAAGELRSQPVVEAGRSIEHHARDVCGVDLGL